MIPIPQNDCRRGHTFNILDPQTRLTSSRKKRLLHLYTKVTQCTGSCLRTKNTFNSLDPRPFWSAKWVWGQTRTPSSNKSHPRYRMRVSANGQCQVSLHASHSCRGDQDCYPGPDSLCESLACETGLRDYAIPSLVPRLLCGEEEREPGTHCSRMRHVPLVTCILLRYGKPFVSKLSIQKLCCARLPNRLDCDKNRLDWKNWLDCDKNRLGCAEIDSICATFASIVSTNWLGQKNDSMQNHRLDVCQVPLNIYWFYLVEVNPSTIESVLRQSSRFAHANRSHTRHLTTPTGMRSNAVWQSMPRASRGFLTLFGSLAFVCLLLVPLLTVWGEEWNRWVCRPACFADCISAHVSGLWSSGVYGYGWRERIDSIA